MTNDTTSSPLELKMELYSIVLSVSTLCLAILFGSGGNITVFLSLCTCKMLAKLRYILLAMLLVLSLIFDMFWCPMEIYRLLYHQHSDQEMDIMLKYVEQSFYIFLIVALTSILLVICIHHMFLISEKFNYLARCLFVVFSILFSVVFMFGCAIGYGLMSYRQEKYTSDEMSYHVLNENSFVFRIILFSVMIAVLVLIVIIMITLYTMKKRQDEKHEADVCSEYSEPPTPERLNIPTLLIKGAEEEHGDENDKDKNKNRSPNSSQKNLSSSSANVKDDNTSTLGDLPSPSRTKNHHLGVNMAAILGRRRHTIGQIGTTGLEVMEKAKQYNYVRKFSVDIQALQAQLENPKIHGGNFPFRSDTELQMSSQNDKRDPSLLKRPLTPILNLRTSQAEIEEEAEKAEQREDDEEENEEEDKCLNERRNSSYETMSPPIITLSETTAEELRLHEARSEKGPNSIKLCCLLVVTFICCLLPMFITDTVRGYLSRNAYINILTCTMALSVIQTIIYPHILFCMDCEIHRAVQKFFGKFHGQLMQVCYGRHEVPTSDHIDITVTQV